MNNSLIEHYYKLKSMHPAPLLFIRVCGDFFKTFNEDALITSKVLGIALTDTDELKLPANEFLDTLMPKLVREGNKVAMCDKLGSPQVWDTDTYGRLIKPGAYESYDSGHPWYYHLRGPILLPEHIERVSHWTSTDIPKNLDKVNELRKKTEEDLKRDIARYKEIASKLNPDDIDECTAISLKHNHISYNRSLLNFIDQRVPVQHSLF